MWALSLHCLCIFTIWREENIQNSNLHPNTHRHHPSKDRKKKKKKRRRNGKEIRWYTIIFMGKNRAFVDKGKKRTRAKTWSIWYLYMHVGKRENVRGGGTIDMLIRACKSIIQYCLYGKHLFFFLLLFLTRKTNEEQRNLWVGYGFPLR